MVKVPPLTIIPPLERSPLLLRLAQTVGGKLLILGLFAGGLSLQGGHWQRTSLILTVLTFLPGFRPQLLVVATLGSLLLTGWPSLHFLGPEPPLDASVLLAIKPALVVLSLLLFIGYYRLVTRRKGAWPDRRPIRNLLLIYLVLLLAGTTLPLSGSLRYISWAFLFIFGHYLWFFGYSLLDRHAKDTPPLARQSGYFLPFWGLAYTPIPKGAAYLRRIEAKTPEELAISQLKGLKLLAWALILIQVGRLLTQLCYGRPGDSFLGIHFSLALPSLSTLIHQAQVHPFPWHQSWLALIARFFIRLVHFSVWGHILIATCRMAGYNALRNTYKPLASVSVADFWNRYYFYFKELLVEHFFYPTFLRFFKRQPRLRIFFATLAAAGFGNFVFHFLQEIEVIYRKGLWEALLNYHVYMFYALVLGLAIGLSQVFEKTKAQEMSWLRRHVISPFLVIGFYCVLSIFDNPDRSLNLGDHFVLLIQLFHP